MATLPNQINLEQTIDFEQFFSYLNVELAEEEKKLLIKKLLASHHGDQDSTFKLFGKDEQQRFIRHDYKKIWMENYFQSLEEKSVKTVVEAEHLYQQHLNAIDEQDPAALEKLNSALLKKKVTDSGAENLAAFIKLEKEKYHHQYKILNKLYKVVGRIEGICHHAGEELPESSDGILKTPDVMRWAHYLSHEDQEISEAIAKLNLHLSHEERMERFEHFAETAGIFLRAISIAISIFSLASGDVSGLFSETTKGGLEQGHMATESSNLLVTGIILLLKGDTKLGLTYLSIGTAMLATQIFSIVADFGLHTLSSGMSTGILSFVSAACCFAMAGITQYRISKATERITTLETNIADLDERLSHPMPAEERQALIQERVDNEKLLLFEKAQRRDLRRSRDLWIASGTLLAVAGIVALVGLCSVTFGVGAILAVAVAAIGVGLSIAKMYTSSKGSYTDQLKQSEKEVSDYTNLLSANDDLIAHADIDLNAEIDVPQGMFNKMKKTTMRDYLRDLMVNNPEKAANVVSALKQLTALAQLEQGTEAYTQAKKQALEDLEDAMKQPTKSTLKAFSSEDTYGKSLFKAITNKAEETEQEDIDDEEGEARSISFS